MATGIWWQKYLAQDPLPPLLSTTNTAVAITARRDFCRAKIDASKDLWQLPEPRRILRRQLEDGSWRYPGNTPGVLFQQNYNLLETYRSLGVLVEAYSFDRRDAAIEAAAEYCFSCQTEEGDLRGIYGSQYTPNYTGAIIELLVKAGYEEDERTYRAFDWLESARQEDGGWTIPARTTGASLQAAMEHYFPLEPVRRKPSSHLITGIVLRAFAAHPAYRRSAVAMRAAAILASRIFEPDCYPDRRAASFWRGVSFPFWFTDALSALDTLTLLGFDARDPHIDQALRWLANEQQSDGLFYPRLLRDGSVRGLIHWVSLASARVFRRLSR
jgi:hypothetical protein